MLVYQDEQLGRILDELARSGNVEWLNGQRSQCLVYWRSPADWARLILAWVEESGRRGQVCTVYEISQGDEVESQEFYQLDGKVLMKALKQLEREGKAQIFQGSGGTGGGSEAGLGVKFL